MPEHVDTCVWCVRGVGSCVHTRACVVRVRVHARAVQRVTSRKRQGQPPVPQLLATAVPPDPLQSPLPGPTSGRATMPPSTALRPARCQGASALSPTDGPYPGLDSPSMGRSKVQWLLPSQQTPGKERVGPYPREQEGCNSPGSSGGGGGVGWGVAVCPCVPPSGLEHRRPCPCATWPTFPGCPHRLQASGHLPALAWRFTTNRLLMV